jgi:hypothetical protein
VVWSGIVQFAVKDFSIKFSLNGMGRYDLSMSFVLLFELQVDALKIAISKDSRKSLDLLEKRLDSIEVAMRQHFTDIKQALTRPRLPHS